MRTKSSPESVPPLHIVFLATTKLEKTQQFNAIAEDERYPIIFLPITALGRPAHSPEENEWNFRGNMKTKCAAGAAYLAQFTPEEVHKALNSLGFTEEQIKTAKFYGAAEDSGLSFDRTESASTASNGKNGSGKSSAPPKENVAQQFINAFFDTTSSHSPHKTEADKEIVEGLRQFYDPKLPFPGSETVRIFGAAGGAPNFFRLVDQTLEQIGHSPNAQEQPREKTLPVRDDSSVGMYEWFPNQPERGYVGTRDEKFLKMVNAHSKSLYHHDASKPFSDARELTTYSYTVNKGRAERGDYTAQEDQPDKYKPASRLNAMKAIATEYDIKRTPPKAWDVLQHNAIFTLGQRDATQPFTIALLQGEGNKARTHSFAERCKRANLHAQAGGHGTEGRLRDDMHHFQQALKGNDAFLVMPPAEQERQDPKRELESHMLLSYLAIHKTLDPEGKGKSVFLLDESGKDWERPIQQLNALFNHGALGDRPSNMFTRVRSEDEALRRLELARTQYRRVSVPEEQESSAPDLKNKTGRYNVCVFLSASMEGVYEKKARSLGRRIQEAGMGLCYGAADRNMMGGLYHGALEHATETGIPAEMLGSTTHVIATTECERGTKPEHLPDDRFYLAPNITKRKEFLFKNSHAFVVLEGGVGTADELMTYMWYKQNNPNMVKDKPMVISESAYTNGSMFKYMLDAFISAQCDKKYDFLHLNKRERQEIAEKTGIVLMASPSQSPSGDQRPLYDIEMDNAIAVLKQFREQTHPELAPKSTAKSYAR